jgi:hypothetical protein
MIKSEPFPKLEQVLGKAHKSLISRERLIDAMFIPAAQLIIHPNKHFSLAPVIPERIGDKFKLPRAFLSIERVV